eukprot:TRINITY_DN26786_c0_g1_i2.p1 TRINITY_DN26786_c0_g1~~TRINITY_DN26786_c0_g1_i2.p1  ORF type:complete len:451 (+),score=49.15 TRINITY_DN26786_c0_g1_i2:75-1427(+)
MKWPMAVVLVVCWVAMLAAASDTRREYRSAALQSVSTGLHEFLGGAPVPLADLLGEPVHFKVLRFEHLRRLAEEDWRRESPPRTRATTTPATTKRPETVAVFNPSLTRVRNGWLVLSKAAALHSCGLRFGRKPTWRKYTLRKHRHKWWSEVVWAVVPENLGSPSQYGVVNMGEVRAAGLRRIESGVVHPVNESARVGRAPIEDPRLHRVGGALVVTWVATAVPEEKGGPLSWGMARTFLSAVTQTPAGDATLSHTVQITVPGLSGKGREKNMHLFDSGGAVWLEYTVEPHVVCKLDVSTGECAEPVRTSVSTLSRLARFGFHPRGGAGLLRLECVDGDCDHLPRPQRAKMLGIGHFCRSPRKGERSCWMYHSFFYAFDAAPPFQMLAASPEWCLPRNGITGCPLVDSAQMVTGVSWDGTDLVLTYGEQDCEPRAVRVSRSAVLRSLRPLE